MKRSSRPTTRQAVIGCIILLLLAVGSAVILNRPNPTESTDIEQKVLAIASQLHAPGDENSMTAATSSLPSAQHMRYQIQQYVLQGKTSTQIMQLMEEQYGTTVLAAPLNQGFGRWVWCMPWVVLVLCASVVGFYWRRIFAANLLLSKKTSMKSGENNQGDSGTQGDRVVDDILQVKLRDFL